ncbi:hypothetical protein RIF29_09538 [Crotalaria pallida]|uniref:Uncharacterized protein n=1 Tax=Crotalaria pallida TaxID=3830 RepID=A0AAN9FRV9_CROPI
MAKKKGKANANTTPSPSSHIYIEEDHNDALKTLTSIDFSALEEEDLAQIDNLSAKEADSLIQNLESAKEAVKDIISTQSGVDNAAGKQVVQKEAGDCGTGAVQESSTDAGNWTQDVWFKSLSVEGRSSIRSDSVLAELLGAE